MCCPRDCVSRHNGGTSGAPLKPLRDDSALRKYSGGKYSTVHTEQSFLNVLNPNKIWIVIYLFLIYLFIYLAQIRIQIVAKSIA